MVRPGMRAAVPSASTSTATRTHASAPAGPPSQQLAQLSAGQLSAAAPIYRTGARRPSGQAPGLGRKVSFDTMGRLTLTLTLTLTLALALTLTLTLTVALNLTLTPPTQASTRSP